MYPSYNFKLCGVNLTQITLSTAIAVFIHLRKERIIKNIPKKREVWVLITLYI